MTIPALLLLAALAVPPAPPSDAASAPPAEAPTAAARTLSRVALPALPPGGRYPSIVPPDVETTDWMSVRGPLHQKYRQEARVLRARHFGAKRAEAVRNAGLARLSTFADPWSFRPLIDELRREATDVKSALVAHFAAQGAAGQQALAWIVLESGDGPWAEAALARIERPLAPDVLALLEGAMRSDDDVRVNRAGAFAAAVGAVEAIPLMLFAQVAPGEREEAPTGDIAWITFEVQVPFVAGLVPVVGDNAAGYLPVVGIIHEGTLMRIVDAVAIIYRTVIHGALVDLTSQAWGAPTEHLGYDPRVWARWYEDDFRPAWNDGLAE